MGPAGDGAGIGSSRLAVRLRAVPGSFDPSVVATIDVQLDTVARDEGVTILLAVESGSRAWGFPSPDSDYDCRFVYLRDTDRYLSLWPARDVIETPLRRDLDVRGWDLGKALRLMLKGNAAVVEWLNAPIVYRGNAAFRDALLALAARHAGRGGIMRHYLRLGERQVRRHLADPTNVPLKQLFYALRPAAALRWLRLHPGHTVAPMHLPTLMAECAPPRDVLAVTAGLLAARAQARETGGAPMPAPVAAFVQEELARAQAACGNEPARPAGTAMAAADAFFRATLALFDPAGVTGSALAP